MARRESHIVSILYRTAVGYALHNGVPANVSSFEAASADLLFMYERARTTPAHTEPRTTHTNTDVVNSVVRHVVASRRYHRQREASQARQPREAVPSPSPNPRRFSRRHDSTTEKCRSDESSHIHENRQHACCRLP